MSLFFRPNPFTDKYGNKIELEDIKVLDVSPERCECGCDSAILNITIGRYKHEPATFKDITIDELQELIEKAWINSSIPEMVFKKK